MATIYIVTSGSYSEYGIHAVYDSKEKAEAVIAYDKAAHGGYSDWDIEEWELNEYYDPVSRGLSCYSVMFPDITQGDAIVKLHSPYDETTEQSLRPYGWAHPYYDTYVWTTDEASALKIANERRTRYLIEHPEP